VLRWVLGLTCWCQCRYVSRRFWFLFRICNWGCTGRRVVSPLRAGALHQRFACGSECAGWTRTVSMGGSIQERQHLGMGGWKRRRSPGVRCASLLHLDWRLGPYVRGGSMHACVRARQAQCASRVSSGAPVPRSKLLLCIVLAGMVTALRLPLEAMVPLLRFGSQGTSPLSAKHLGSVLLDTSAGRPPSLL
jgi:hypothetical protein